MKITCPTCNAVYNIPNHKIPDGKRVSAKCKKCDGAIVVEVKVEEATPKTHKAEPSAIKKTKTEEKEGEAIRKQETVADVITEEELKIFFGEDKGYYLARWRKIYDKNTKASWNWAAAIFGIGWLGLRKMYLYICIVFFLFSTSIIEQVLDISIYWFVNLSLIPLLGVFGNYLYLKHAEKKVLKIKNAISDHDLQRAKIAKKGGVNYLIFICLILFPLIPIIFQALKVGK